MSILSFGQFASKKQVPASQDWTNQELADFFRAHRLLVQNGSNIGMDRGRSDIGEPWMVFYDTSSQDVFLHIAKIDGRCILVCEHLSIKLSAPQIDLLITRFEDAIRSTFALRAERGSNVVVHPAAKIIMSISAVFLLFKLDSSSSVFAREAVGSVNTDATSRKAELALPARVQSALNRLLDSVENPAAIAALASVILAADLISDDHEAAVLSAATHQSQTSSDLELLVDVDPNGTTQTDLGLVEPVHIKIDLEVPVVITSATAMLIDLIIRQLASSSDPVEVGPTARLDLEPAFQQANEFQQTQPTVLAASGSPTESGGQAVAGSTAVTPIALSLQVLGNAASFNFASIAQSELASGVVFSAGGELLLDVNPSLDVDLNASLNYGFSSETTLQGDELMMVLRHIISGMDGFELTSNEGVLVVEQIDIDAHDPALLGIWSNSAPDGGSMTIIGQVDLMDDIVGLLSERLVA
jgi:hypothetical protein